MADGQKDGNFYSVLGLEEECSEKELKKAYKKLAMKWHPDKCSDSSNVEQVEEAKEKFQHIQEAYSVLSNSSRRFLYDVGAYDSNDHDDKKGMSDFLDEMTQIINDNKHQDNSHETFEDLQRMFVELFQDDLNAFAGSCSTKFGGSSSSAGYHGSSSAAETYKTGGGSGDADGGSNKRSVSGKSKLGEFDVGSTGFCFGLDDSGQTSRGRGSSSNSRRRNGRKY